MEHLPLTPELALQAYAAGVFPMAESRDSERLLWLNPRRRGVFPLDGFNISRSLRRAILRGDYQVTVNRNFRGVLQGCADREETWINPQIESLCHALHAIGHAHSLEVWDGAALIGGVYGLTIGGGFFGESMFSRRTDASKIALAYTVDRLRQGGFTLFDTQFLTPHLASLGAVEISREEYQTQLTDALALTADFTAPSVPEPQLLIQRNTQTS